MAMPKTFFPPFFWNQCGRYQNVIKDLRKCHNVHTQLPVCLTRLSKHEADLDVIIPERCLEHKVPRESCVTYSAAVALTWSAPHFPSLIN